MTRSKSTVASAALLAVFTLPVVAQAQEPASGTVKIPDGTPVRLSLQEELNSATAHTGDLVHLEAAEDVRVGSMVVIPSGSAAVGHIVEAEHKKRLGRGGKLNFSVDYVKLPEGANEKVRASAAREGKDKTGKVIVGTVLVSPLFLLMHGKDVDIPKGTTFTAYTDGEHEVALPGSGPQIAARAADPPQSTTSKPASDPPSASTQAAASDRPAASVEAPATVVLKSNPDGADISVDGDYMGSTPSSLRLKPGHHAIAIEKAGFKPWQRNLNVTADGTVTVDAVLEKSL